MGWSLVMGGWELGLGGMVWWSSIPGISTLTTDIMYLLLVSALAISVFLCWCLVRIVGASTRIGWFRRPEVLHEPERGVALCFCVSEICVEGIGWCGHVDWAR